MVTVVFCIEQEDQCFLPITVATAVYVAASHAGAVLRLREYSLKSSIYRLAVFHCALAADVCLSISCCLFTGIYAVGCDPLASSLVIRSTCCLFLLLSLMVYLSLKYSFYVSENKISCFLQFTMQPASLARSS